MEKLNEVVRLARSISAAIRDKSPPTEEKLYLEQVAGTSNQQDLFTSFSSAIGTFAIDPAIALNSLLQQEIINAVHLIHILDAY